MPSASVQSTIQAFEALSSSSSLTTTNTTSPQSTPTLGSRPSSSTSNLLESPLSPSASVFHPISPFVVPNPFARSRSQSPLTPSLTGKASLIDLKDWVVEDGPVERPASSRLAITNGAARLGGIPESSRASSPSAHAPSNSSAPLVNFASSEKPRPPLPPRKPSFNTGDCTTQHPAPADNEPRAMLCPPGLSDSLAIEHTYPPSSRKFGAGRVGHVPASSISSFHSVSLSSDGSNVEVHSPKLPSLTVEAVNTAPDFDTASIAESFENVSVSSAVSPSTPIAFNWEHAISKSRISPKREPPGLPSRPSAKIPPAIPPKPLARSVSISSSSTATSTKTHRPPPPPPPYQLRSMPSSSRASVVSTSASTSDRSSILSNATTTSRTSISTRNSAQFGSSVKSSPLLRPTPVPPAARSRYEALFDSAVKGRRRAESAAEKKKEKSKLLASRPPARKDRQAAGWRGLSVDLIANPEDHPVLSSAKKTSESESEEEESSPPIGPEEKLNGRIVKHIWYASQLDRKKLSSMWNGCDPQCTGLIDRDTFVKGMWRIDEELRRAQLARRTSALTAASSQRIPHRPLPLPESQRTTRLLI